MNREATLTPELAAQLLPLYGPEKAESPTVVCKVFSPLAEWTWFETESEPREGDLQFFGYVIGQEEEWVTSSSRTLKA